MAKTRQQKRQEARKSGKNGAKKRFSPLTIGIFTAAVLAVIALLAVFVLKPSNTNHPKVMIEMENGGKITMELYPEYAPETVENFVSLVKSGFYDGLTFHRIVDGFMAQGGDPEGNGQGGSEKTIKGEFSQNGFSQNTLSHTRGVVSMARSQDPDSASSQFFICYDDASFLDGQYAAFGKVIDGMDVVDDFCKVERTANELGEQATPKTPLVMKKVTVVE